MNKKLAPLKIEKWRHARNSIEITWMNAKITSSKQLVLTETTHVIF